MNAHNNRPDLYMSASHTCPYLADRSAANLLIDPNFPVSPALYDQLITQGFRRNGTLYYRPQCAGCCECRSVRINVNHFTHTRSQRRTLKYNQDITLKLRPADYCEEHFSLYRRYQTMRHSGDSMDDPDPEKYRQFLTRSDVETFITEFRAGRRLLAVSVTDHIANGLSAVYTFFEPDEKRRTLGTYAILQQLELARRIEYEWLYLGYWIKTCGKMSYKARFRPLEAFDHDTGRWASIN
ncbi:MAG TPA: arginyltransferase [Gammaproteobacteria bacterium]|nr:arginyltransferase [Gammaproteobacteria bacterium]